MHCKCAREGQQRIRALDGHHGGCVHHHRQGQDGGEQGPADGREDHGRHLAVRAVDICCTRGGPGHRSHHQQGRGQRQHPEGDLTDREWDLMDAQPHGRNGGGQTAEPVTDRHEGQRGDDNQDCEGDRSGPERQANQCPRRVRGAHLVGAAGPAHLTQTRGEIFRCRAGHPCQGVICPANRWSGAPSGRQDERRPVRPRGGRRHGHTKKPATTHRVMAGSS